MISSRHVWLVLTILLVFSGCKFRRDPHIGRTISATSIQVLHGDEFDIVLVDGERIHAFLPVGAPPQAKEKVTKLMNKCVYPRVVFKAKIDKGWVVDVKFGLPICNGQFCVLDDESLVEWLRTNGLSWE